MYIISHAREEIFLWDICSGKLTGQHFLADGDVSCMAVYGTTIVIGRDSGKVSFYELSNDFNDILRLVSQST